MKEATGELNMTVITVVAIAAVAAFFYAFVWPGIRSQIQASTYCAMNVVCDDMTNYTGCKAYDDQGQEIWSGSCQAYMKKQAAQGNGGTPTNPNP